MYRIQRRNGYFNSFDNLFDNFFSSSTSPLLRTDVKENEKEYELVVDVPGLDKEDINITLEKGYLSISVNKVKEEETKEAYYLKRERLQTGASRKFYVGETLKETDIEAKLDKGVLKVVIPKIEEKVVTEKVIEIH